MISDRFDDALELLAQDGYDARFIDKSWISHRHMPGEWFLGESGLRREAGLARETAAPGSTTHPSGSFSDAFFAYLARAEHNAKKPSH